MPSFRTSSNQLSSAWSVVFLARATSSDSRPRALERTWSVVVDRGLANPWDDESDDEASNSAGWGARLLMVPALVFFGVATLLGCLFRGIVRLRLRAVARQSDVSDGELCELKQANRITSVAVVTSLVGLAAVGLAYLVF